MDRVGANLFFQLISRRCERGPMILTSNQSFGAWGEVFGDRMPFSTGILSWPRGTRSNAPHRIGEALRHSSSVVGTNEGSMGASFSASALETFPGSTS